MRILWHNVIALILFVTAIVIAVKNRYEIVAFLMTMDDIGPGHTVEQQVRGLLATAFLAVVLVVIVRILVSRHDRRDG